MVTSHSSGLGRLERFRTFIANRTTLALLLALIFVFFFGTLILSARSFPQNYDWRYRVISNLLSPRDNPAHYRLAAAGVAFSAVLMLPFVVYFRQHFGSSASRAADFAAAAFLAGILALIGASLVVPQHTHAVLGMRRLHELLGRSAAAFLAVGMICACRCAWLGRRRSQAARWLAWLWSMVTLLPLLGLFASALLLLLVRLHLGWASIARNSLRGSIFWYLGFWEWIGAAAVFAFLSAIPLLMPLVASDGREHSERG